jgi:two-component sensor histidine kinase
MRAPYFPDQVERRAAIRRFELGARAHAQQLEGIVELASQITGCPVALVTTVHEEGQFFEAASGLDLEGTGRERSVCQHAILQGDVFEIADLREDPRTAQNPLVTDPEDPLVFYAGAPIVTESGVPLGTVCVLDRRPRRLGDAERRSLAILAGQAMRMLELHEAVRKADELRREADHRVKNSLASIAALARMSAARAEGDETRAALRQVQSRIEATAKLHAELYRQDMGPEGIEVSEYLARIVRHLSELAPPDVTVSCRVEPVRLKGAAAAALGLLLNEMVSNAFKHGYPDGRAGQVRVAGCVDPSGRYELTCIDDGIGGAAPVSTSGLGGRLMLASAQDLGGEVTRGPLTDGAGYAVKVTFNGIPVAAEEAVA